MNMRRIWLVCFLWAPLTAQWIKQPTTGIPRTPDGKPNLSAPAPKAQDGKPDFSGLWRINSGAYGGNITQDLKPGDVATWAEALFKQRSEDLSKDHMGVLCLPMGPGYSLGGGGLTKIIQTPGLIVILHEDLTYRQVFLDGRMLPKDPNPSWMGYSVGHWDGDTLVVKTSGYNERSWLDAGGHPHTEGLVVTERFQRRDFGHVDLEVTFEDPPAFAKPILIKAEATLAADTELLEYVCNENEKDRPHLVGKASDDKKLEVKVAPEILAKYAGAYEFRPPGQPGIVVIVTATIVDGQLILELGRGKLPPAIAISETTFSGAGGVRISFVKNERDEVTKMQVQTVEGEFSADRRK